MSKVFPIFHLTFLFSFFFGLSLWKTATSMVLARFFVVLRVGGFFFQTYPSFPLPSLLDPFFFVL